MKTVLSPSSVEIKERNSVMKLYNISHMLIRRVSSGLGVLALLALFCVQPGTALAATTHPAFVRIIHASPDIGIVDAFVDGQKILSNFEFGTVTDYVPLPAGSHKLQIALIGKGINASLVTQTMLVDEGAAYTIAALGTNASGFSFSVFKDNNLVAGSGAKVRVYHLSPFAGAVSIEAGNDTIVQGLSYPQASNYVNVPAGAYTFNLTGAAQYTPAPLSTDVKPWTVTSIFAVGPMKGNTQIRFVSTEIAGTPGMPQTGSDPTPVYTQPSWSPAIYGGGILLLIGLVSSYGLGRYGRRKIR
jgi:Domain of unknown function (DUF4397)